MYEHLRIVTQAASELLSISIDERVERLRQYLEERDFSLSASSPTIPRCPISVEPTIPYLDHIDWLSALSDVDVQRGMSWLRLIVDSNKNIESHVQHGRLRKG
jgi:hypothetical protein